MGIVNQDIKSPQFSLSTTDWNSILKSAIVLLIPLVTLYVTQVTGALQAPNHVFSVLDFIPTSFTQGGMVLYILNRITDITRRYIS